MATKFTRTLPIFLSGTNRQLILSFTIFDRPGDKAYITVGTTSDSEVQFTDMETVEEIERTHQVTNRKNPESQMHESVCLCGMRSVCHTLADAINIGNAHLKGVIRHEDRKRNPQD